MLWSKQSSSDVYLPPANIATKTIPQDHRSAGSALYSPFDKTYKRNRTITDNYYQTTTKKKYVFCKYLGYYKTLIVIIIYCNLHGSIKEHWIVKWMWWFITKDFIEMLFIPLVQHMEGFHSISPGDAPCLCGGIQLKSQNQWSLNYLWQTREKKL